MEPQTNESQSVIEPLKKVTPLSRYLALVLFITLPFLGGWIGYHYAPEKLVVNEVLIDSSDWSLPEKNVELPKDEERNNVIEEPKSIDSIPNIYASTSYRTVAVLHNPYYPDETKYDTVVIVAQRGINDYSCGGKYVPSKCYIFLESSYAETETPKFVGIWTDGAINPKTLRFISPNEILIDTGFNDACINVKATSIYNLNTGSSTIESYEDLSSDC